MNGSNATHQVDHWFVVLLCGTINTIVLVVVVGGGWWMVGGVTHTLGHGMDGTTQAGVVLIDASHPIVVVA